MLSAFLVSLREGVEAALIVGLCLAYLRKIQRADLERPVWYAVGAALLASVGAAALLERFAWNQESVEGLLMLLAALLLVGMIVWMRRVARSLRGEIESQVGRLAGRERLAALGLFLFVFSMVLREGIETVIFLGAVSMNSEGILVIFGALLGLATACAFGLFFFKGTLPIRLDRFFDATSIMLIVIAVQLTLTGIHELSEALVIPSGPWMMRALGPIVRNDVFFFAVLLGTATWLVARELLRRRHTLEPESGLNEAERRRHRWQQQRERRWMTATAVTAFVVVVALAADHVYARAAGVLSPATPVEAASAEVRLPVAQVNDGNLHRFSFTDESTTVRFIVIRRPDGRLATALDACQICGPQGYYQEGANVICKNCAAVIYIPSIGLPGGCNPVPIESRLEGEELVIPVSQLTEGKIFFRHH
jgi:FTR1 family protein